jgi:hypothetical protein
MCNFQDVQVLGVYAVVWRTVRSLAIPLETPKSSVMVVFTSQEYCATI